jgi:hypothetical protein
MRSKCQIASNGSVYGGNDLTLSNTLMRLSETMSSTQLLSFTSEQLRFDARELLAQQTHHVREVDSTGLAASNELGGF